MTANHSGVSVLTAGRSYEGRDIRVLVVCLSGDCGGGAMFMEGGG